MSLKNVAGHELPEISSIVLSTGKDARGSGIALVKPSYPSQGCKFTAQQVMLLRSFRGVLRGPHIASQVPMSKMVACIEGVIFDVVVDCRPRSGNYGRWSAYRLTSDSQLGLFIPPGFAHAFQAESSSSLVSISIDCVDVSEEPIDALDPELDIGWPIRGSEMIRSAKDAEAGHLSGIRLGF